MLIDPPATTRHYPDRMRVILRCDVHNMSFLVTQSYNIGLIFTSTMYAVRTRKIPENFNESKFIGFTMYTTCIIWLAFVPIYFSTEHSHEVGSARFDGDGDPFTSRQPSPPPQVTLFNVSRSIAYF